MRPAVGLARARSSLHHAPGATAVRRRLVLETRRPPAAPRANPCASSGARRSRRRDSGRCSHAAGTASRSADRRRRSTCCSARAATRCGASAASPPRSASNAAVRRARTHAALGADDLLLRRAPRAAPAPNRSSAPASKTTPLRAPVTRASTALRRLRQDRLGRGCRRRWPAAGNTARGRRPRSSTSTIVRNSGCGPRRSTPQSTNRAARTRRALPPNQRWRCRNGDEQTRARSASGRCRRAACPTPTPTKSAGRLSATARRFPARRAP